MIDTGGMCSMYSHAINKYTEHTCRVAVTQDTRGCDTDIVLDRQMWSEPDNIDPKDKLEMIRDLANKCDVMIFNAALMPGVASSKHQTASDTFDVKWEDIYWNDYIDKKKCFAFFLGANSLRSNYKYYVDLHKEKGWSIITCQPDIYVEVKKLYDRVYYVPILVNNDLPRYKVDIKKTKEIIAIHSPTHRMIKNTAEFLRVCRRLSRENSDFRVNLIENYGFNDSINIKRHAHIGFDQMQASSSNCVIPTSDYYCLSSVENAALGLVNLVSLSDGAIEIVKAGINCDRLEWEIVHNEDELYKTMKKYAQDRDLLFDKRIKSYKWHHKYWSDEKLISKLTGILSV